MMTNVGETLWSESNVSAQSIYQNVLHVFGYSTISLHDVTSYEFVFVRFFYIKSVQRRSIEIASLLYIVRMFICLMFNAHTLCANIYKNGGQFKGEGN